MKTPLLPVNMLVCSGFAKPQCTPMGKKRWVRCDWADAGGRKSQIYVPLAAQTLRGLNYRLAGFQTTRTWRGGVGGV